VAVVMWQLEAAQRHASCSGL